MNSQKNDKEEILLHVKEYYNKYHTNKESYKEGDRIPYAARVYDSEEMTNLVDSALEFWLTSGRYTDNFEKNFSGFLGTKYCSLVNSGSSANLLAFMALTSPLLEKKQIKAGDEVITVAAGFPTTISPIVQSGAIPVFVDVTIPEYNIDITKLEKALSDKTKAIILAHTLGNPFNINYIKEFCCKHNLWLIEDNCDSLGSKYCLEGEWGYTGTFGDISTSSFYPPHHMTMGEGGAVYTKNPLLAKIVKSMRDWGRDCECPSGVDNLCNHRFDRQYGDLPIGYDHKYVYSHWGYNLKATDMQAAIGCAQLKKLPLFIEKRKGNFNRLKNGLQVLHDKLILPEACANADPSWFGFPITCKKGTNRKEIVMNLEKHGIQTRMLFAGNITKHPCFSQLKERKIGFRIVDELENTDTIMNDTFWIGVYPGLTDEMINYIVAQIIEAVKN